MKGKPPTKMSHTQGERRAYSSAFGWPSPPTGYPLTVSHIQLRPLLAQWEAARREPQAANTSPDLGLSTVAVTLSDGGIAYSNGELVTWEVAQRIIATPNQCFTITR